MSFQTCPPPPKASMSNMNPSWSPAVRLQQDTSNINPSWSPVIQAGEGNSVSELTLNASQHSSPYYPCSSGRFVKDKEIIAPEVLAAIQKNHYLVRQIKGTWWMTVEHQEEPFANPQDSFLVRRDLVDYDILVMNPTEEEKASLTYKKLFMKNEMGYFRTIWIIVEYGTTYEGNRHWTRHTVAYLKDGVSPYPFQKDCRPEHHTWWDVVPAFK